MVSVPNTQRILDHEQVRVKDENLLVSGTKFRPATQTLGCFDTEVSRNSQVNTSARW